MINEILNKNPEVIFIVPFGVEETIFPWGINLIRSYLRKSCDSLTTEVWDFRNDKSFIDINKRYGKLLAGLFLSLKASQMSVFITNTINPYLFFGIAAAVGDKLFPASTTSELNDFQKEVNRHIAAKIDDFKRTSWGAGRIWAFSVYDNTVFNSLYIAQLIRQNDPEAAIVFGGDYFDFQNSQELIHQSALVDGVVVGYGEEVLRVTVEEFKRGNSIRDLQVPGLVNQGFLQAGAKTGSLMNLNVPSFYQNPAGHIITYAQKSGEDVIRVLTQRGCSWGKCIFCSQIDKDKYFPFAGEHLLRDIQSAIETTKSKYIKLVFDADENNFELFVQLIKYLESLKSRNLCFEITLWLQVKSFRKDLADVLSKINPRLIRILFALNFESLNFETLKNMRKGHTPLQAIEAAKAILDCGHSFSSNYFNHYPLETRNGISNEITFLRRIVHLFMPPKGRLNSFPYAANNRDAIYQNQDQYQIKAAHLPGDQWVSGAFGVNIPFSFWSYSYFDKPALKFDHLLRFVYYQARKAWIGFELPSVLVKVNWGELKPSFKEQVVSLARLGRCLVWEAVLGLLSLFKKGRVYQQRFRILSFLGKIGTMDPEKARGMHSSLLIRNHCLEKEYRTPWDREKYSITLTDHELKILRFLYWSRKSQDITAEFKNTIPEAEITGIINRHLQLGSLVQFRDSLLCTANDPEYWGIRK